MEISKLLDQAKEELELIYQDEEFQLKDLFKGYEWKRIKQGDKSTLGTLFLSYIKEKKDFKIIRKPNGIIYKRI